MDRRKLYRKNNKAYRNACRKRNYDKSKPAGKRCNRPWIAKEYLALQEFSFMSDRILSILLGRSVGAIQTKRSLLRKEAKHGRTKMA